MKTVHLLYVTDAWLSTGSKVLAGVATSKKGRDRMVRDLLRNHLYTKATRDEIADAIKQVDESGQTQTLSERHDIELLCEETYTNTVNY